MSDIDRFLRDFNAAWLQGNVPAVLDGVTENIRFRMASEKGVTGKDAFGRMLREMSRGGQAYELDIDQVIVNGERAAVNGLIRCRAPEGGRLSTYAFCDVYRLAGGEPPRVEQLTAYVMEVKGG